MRIFIIFAFLLPLSADAKGRWVLDKEERFEATKEAEIAELFQKFPEVARENPGELEYFQVSVRQLHWKGKSSCKAGDARLKLQTVDTESRSKPGPNGEQSGGASASGMAAADPCEADLPPDGRWVLLREKNAEYRSDRELAQYLEKNRRNFPQTKAEELEFATEKLLSYQWVGKTRCAAGDPRLFQEIDSGEVRFKRDLASLGGSGFGSGGAVESVRDPCRQ